MNDLDTKPDSDLGLNSTTTKWVFLIKKFGTHGKMKRDIQEEGKGAAKRVYVARPPTLDEILLALEGLPISSLQLVHSKAEQLVAERCSFFMLSVFSQSFMNLLIFLFRCA
jgi:hypothetical protein